MGSNRDSEPYVVVVLSSFLAVVVVVAAAVVVVVFRMLVVVETVDNTVVEVGTLDFGTEVDNPVMEGMLFAEMVDILVPDKVSVVVVAVAEVLAG